ncbi:MAG TPA: transcriptional regulator, partial [Arthrobacter bacterium]|nr:transcriptional regulator [Arthrobacter sp.]HCB57130.1 transcriptional regulator [Arthrobacter sp.]HCC38924.1 transcriptional regulator [Arthrobacter sp.]HCN22603.1 transcriptional regulator [Arthrobacter sp.]
AWLLVLDSLIFQTEAEVRWLDLCEARMVQQAQNGQATARKSSNGVTVEEAAPLIADNRR